MTLDPSTLKLAGGVVTVASGLFLAIHWSRDRTSWAAFWWAVGNIVSGVGITLTAVHDLMPDIVWQSVAPLIIGFGFALIGVAAWIFEDGSVRRDVSITAIGLWFALTVFAAASGYGRLEIALEPGLSGLICAAAALKIWSGRDEALSGRAPLVWVLGLMAFALVVVAFGVSTPAMLQSPKVMLSIFGIIQFMQLVYAVGSAMFLVEMLKGRTEARHKLASLTDPLTGLPNRRAFVERGKRQLDRCNHEQSPVALLAFDLDKFKTINDAFGHPCGDQVLQIFGEVLSRILRSTDNVARVGGEEFVALLPACDPPAAFIAANRVRSAFEADARYVKGRLVAATVSVGVATDIGGGSLDDLIASADQALYRAKMLGRNRVVFASDPENVVRFG